jgi:hypothetical protein
MKGSIREDDEGFYFIPLERVNEYDELEEKIYCLPGGSEQWCAVVDGFVSKFEQYRLEDPLESYLFEIENEEP